MLYPARALLRLLEAGDPGARRSYPSRPAASPGSAPPSPPDLTAARLTPLQQQLVPEFLAETDGMLGMQLPAGFRSWLHTVPPVRPVGSDQLAVVELELRWGFELANRIHTLRLPLPVSDPSASRKLRVEL